MQKFSKQYDPSEHLTAISEDVECQNVIRSLEAKTYSISYVIDELWPRLGLLPIDPANPVTAAVAEYFLNELILKDTGSTSLESLELG